MADRDESETEGGFLSRWSRRKREEQMPPAEPVDAEELEAALAEEPEAEPLKDEEAEANRVAAEAVDLDALKDGDDFTLFMRRGVPQAIRQKALRKLWTSNPVLANLDGLNDYDDDYGDPKLNVYSSIWKAGRGFLSELEQATQHSTGRLKQPEPEPEAEPEESGEPEEVALAAEAAAEETIEPDAAPVIDADDENPDEDAPPKRVSLRRRLES